MTVLKLVTYNENMMMVNMLKRRYTLTTNIDNTYSTRLINTYEFSWLYIYCLFVNNMLRSELYNKANDTLKHLRTKPEHCEIIKLITYHFSKHTNGEHPSRIDTSESTISTLLTDNIDIYPPIKDVLDESLTKTFEILSLSSVNNESLSVEYIPEYRDNILVYLSKHIYGNKVQEEQHNGIIGYDGVHTITSVFNIMRLQSSELQVLSNNLLEHMQ